MTLATAYSRAQLGLLAPEIAVEAHVAGGLPQFTIIGLIETAVRESRDRVRAAIQQSGLNFPDGRITVNLAPADLPKTGSGFDLAIAIAILAASDQVPEQRLQDCELLGELAFSGALRRVPGLLPALIAARPTGRVPIVPAAGEAEAALLGDRSVIRLAGCLIDVVGFLRGNRELPLPSRRAALAARPGEDDDAGDLADVQGQLHGRRALEIAAVGGHHLLLSGPPGTGKTMLARRLAGLLPELSEEESLECAAIHSLVNPVGLFRRRPFRAPHHTASTAAMVGGGGNPRPGEISLAHRGVLFLDELPEFARPVLEALREPLGTGHITIARALRAVEYPARFQLVAAMNPCPCGFSGDSRQACTCTPHATRRYQQRVSGPLLDRIDMVVSMGRGGLQPRAARGESTAQVRCRVVAACERRSMRAKADPVPDDDIDAAASRLLDEACARFALSARAGTSIRRVARTIADLAGSTRVSATHVAEALTYRVRPGGATQADGTSG